MDAKYISYIKENKIDDHIPSIKLQLNDLNCLTFDTNVYINEIYKTYKFDVENIKKQFLVDAMRMNIIINNKPISSFNDFGKNLHWFKNIKIENLYNLTMMLCNQSSYGFSYELMHKLHYNENCLITNTSTNRQLHINTTDDNLMITLEHDLCVMNSFNNKIIKKINIVVYITSESYLSLLMNNSWDINDIIKNNSLIVWKYH